MSPFTFNPRSFGVWFGGIFLLVGLPLFVVSLFLFYDDWRFSQKGRSTEGTVLTKDIRESDDRTSADRRAGRSRSRTKHYEVTYRFSVQGKALEGRDELTLADWERLRAHGPVEVLYLPHKPSSSRVAGHRPWLMKVMFVLIGSVFTVFGGTVVVRSVRHARLEGRLRLHGVSTQGTVTELRVGNLRINDVQQWRLRYEYRDHQGDRHVKTIDMPEDEARQWKVGDVGSVRYDPARPTEAVWFGRDSCERP